MAPPLHLIDWRHCHWQQTHCDNMATGSLPRVLFSFVHQHQPTVQTPCVAIPQRASTLEPLSDTMGGSRRAESPLPRPLDLRPAI